MTAYLKLISNIKKAKIEGNIELTKKLESFLLKIDNSLSLYNTPFGNYKRKI